MFVGIWPPTALLLLGLELETFFPLEMCTIHAIPNKAFLGGIFDSPLPSHGVWLEKWLFYVELQISSKKFLVLGPYLTPWVGELAICSKEVLLLAPHPSVSCKGLHKASKQRALQSPLIKGFTKPQSFMKLFSKGLCKASSKRFCKAPE